MCTWFRPGSPGSFSSVNMVGMDQSFCVTTSMEWLPQAP
jgi:hypothetical protein